MADLSGIHKAPPVQPQPAHAQRIVMAAKPTEAPKVRLSDLYVVETVANGKITMDKFPVNPE
jgi:hypothetical protein